MSIRNLATLDRDICQPLGRIINDAFKDGWTATYTPSGTSAVNNIDIGVTDACTMSSGYAHGIHISMNNTGEKSGGCSVTQVNGLGVDYTLTEGGAAGFYGFYTYIGKSGTPDLENAAVAGAVLDIAEVGATDYLVPLWLNKYNTTKATSIDAFILMACQGSGVAKAGFVFQGTQLPDNLIEIASGARDMLVLTAGTYSTAEGYFKVSLNGSDYRIPFYAGTD